jgi:hypothetical protein
MTSGAKARNDKASRYRSAEALRHPKAEFLAGTVTDAAGKLALWVTAPKGVGSYCASYGIAKAMP